MLLAWGNYHSFAVAWPGCMCSHFHPSYLEQDLHVPMSGCAGAGVQLGNVGTRLKYFAGTSSLQKLHVGYSTQCKQEGHGGSEKEFDIGSYKS